jgi:hypothetical protein
MVAEALAAVVATAAHLPTQHCLAARSRRCWVTQTSAFVGGMEVYRGHSEASGVEAVEEALGVAWVVVAVAAGTRRSLGRFESGTAAESAPVVVGH